MTIRYNKKLNYENQKSGFIALVSMLILSAVLAILMISNSTGTFLSRFDTLDKENHFTAQSLAESCVNFAMLKISEDYDFNPQKEFSYSAGKGLPVLIKNNVCYIESIDPLPPRNGSKTVMTIITTGKYQNSISRNIVTVQFTNPKNTVGNTNDQMLILSWEEI